MLKKNPSDEFEIKEINSKYTIIILIIIVLLSALFRLWDLRNNPKWYGDEIGYINSALSLITGKLSLGAVKWIFLIPWPSPPFYNIVNGVLLLFKRDILILRLFCAFLGVITTVIIYLIGKEFVNKRVGLISSFVFAIYPLAININRRVFPHNLAMLFITLAFYFCLVYRRTKDKNLLFLIGIICALASLTTYWVVGLFIFVYMFFFFVDRKQLKIVFLLSISLIVIFFLWLFLQYREYFLSDIKGMMRLASGSRDKNFITYILQNYYNFFNIDYFIAAGIIGLLFAPKLENRIIIIGLFLSLSFEIFRQRENIPVFFYPAIILVPVLALGIGIMISRISYFITKLTKRQITDIVVTFIIIPFLPFAYNDFRQCSSGFVTKMDYWAIQNHIDLEETAIFVNANVKEEDFVLASSNLWWLVKCNSADLVQSAAQNGITSDFIPVPLDKNRFIFNCDYKKAKYLIIDNLVRRWMISQNGVIDILHNIETEGWKKVFERGEYVVYANPLIFKEKEQNIIIGNPYIYSVLGKKYFDLKLYDNALLEFKKCLAIVPNDEITHLNIAITYHVKGDKENAIREYKRTLEINPSNKEAIANLKSLGVELQLKGE